MAARVDAFAQIFAWFEVRYVLTGQSNSLSRLGISTNTRRSKVQRKAAEPSDLDALAPCQSVTHQVKKVLDGQFHILGWEVFLLACDNFYKF